MKPAHQQTTTHTLTPKPKIFKTKPERSIEWFGGVTYENLQSVLTSIKHLLKENPDEEIQLLVNSYGGATAIGMGFFDSVKSLLRPKHLTTIGTGEVDSSGVIIFLTGEKRYLTKNTTMLFHLAGRTFDANKRFSTRDMEQILKENKLKDYQYACIVSDATSGRSTPEDILRMMDKETILTAEEAVQMGLAHKVLP